MKRITRRQDDEIMMALFERFQTLRHELADRFVRDRMIRHSHYNLSSGRRPHFSFVFSTMAKDFTSALISGLNRFLSNVHQADCWRQAIRTCNEDLRPGLLWEFADPLVELSVGWPYVMKSHFAFAAAHLLHEANMHASPSTTHDLPPDSQINYKELLKHGGDWKALPSFLNALGKLNDASFCKATRNFRHLCQHRFRLHFDTGLTPVIHRKKDTNGTTYTFGVYPPLKLNNLFPKLYYQHQMAADAFSAYWLLLKELNSAFSEITAIRSHAKN